MVQYVRNNTWETAWIFLMISKARIIIIEAYIFCQYPNSDWTCIHLTSSGPGWTVIFQNPTNHWYQLYKCLRIMIPILTKIGLSKNRHIQNLHGVAPSKGPQSLRTYHLWSGSKFISTILSSFKVVMICTIVKSSCSNDVAKTEPLMLGFLTVTEALPSMSVVQI